MIKTEVINITRYPIRRADVNITVSYSDDLQKVRDVLLDIVKNEPQALTDPAPLFLVDKFADSGINILFGVWSKREDLFDLKTSLMIAIKERFKQENIEIPFPHILIANAEDIKC
jgi:small-conductance mechanosensitive channel